MDITKLKYTKDSHEVPLRNVKTERQPQVVADDQESHSVKGVPLYEKTEGTLSISLIVVISGGTVREKNFFRAIQPPQFKFTKILFKSKDNQGWSPLQMEDFWNSCKALNSIEDEDGQKIGIFDADKVFLVSDVDDFRDQLVQVLGRKEAADGSQWIISNPCFEIWLYYCYGFNNPEKDLYALNADVVHRRSSHLKTINGTLINGGMDPTKAIYGMKIGISYSQEHYSEDEQGIPALFSTQMHFLAQCLIDTMNNRKNEFDQFLKENSNAIESWMSKIRT